MSARRIQLAIATSLLLAACGGGSPTGPGESYDQVGGSYSVPISSTAGVPLTAVLSFTLVQNGGSLSGTEAVSGYFNGNIPIAGNGTFTGTIGSGTNPSVNIVVSGAACPSRHTTYSGTNDTANHRMTLTGPFYIVNSDCSIAYAYNLTLVLTH